MRCAKAGLMLTVVVLLSPVTFGGDEYAKSINEELLRMYVEDQGDRSGQVDWSLVAPRDEERARWDLPPLARAKEREAAMNRR